MTWDIHWNDHLLNKLTNIKCTGGFDFLEMKKSFVANLCVAVFKFHILPYFGCFRESRKSKSIFSLSKGFATTF